ncbi:MAG TPA: mechanosensitive ion channel domain-containing protein [Magnetospirillum sp.]|jgi:small-conductance mechanosensitive channel|nr:mechanosensitive ion channel domain-containing protein [Magnetospirillum sp.]
MSPTIPSIEVRNTKFGLRALLLVGMLCLASGQAAAIPPSEAAPTAVEAGDETASLRRSLEAVQATYRQALTANERPAGATREEVVERNQLMGELVASLQHALEAAERLPSLRRRVAAQETRTREWTAFPNPPPYSILIVDQLRAALNTATFKVQAADARTGLLKQQEVEAEQRYKAAEIAKRQGEEGAAQAVAAEQRERQLWLVDLANLRSRAAAASLEENRNLRSVTGAEADEQRELLRLLEKQVATARQTAQFSQADLDAVLADLDRRRTILEKQADLARAASQRSRQALVAAQQALAEIKANSLGASQLDILEKTEEWRRLQADNDELAAEIARRVLDVHAWERTGWQLRWLLLNSGERDKLRNALSDVDHLVHRLQTWNVYLESEIARTPNQDDRSALERLGGLSKEQSALAGQIQAAHRARVEILRNGQQAIASLLRTLSIWRQDVLARGADRAPAAIVRDVAEDLWQGARAVWQFEFFSVEDTLEIDGRKVVAARSVTVGKALGAILFLVIGYLASTWMARHLGRFAVRRLSLVAGHANILSRWLHFTLFATVFISALYMVNIPLTVFAFLGGALAIGLGFGTQVLLKNLVSGLMLLVERPLRVGDLIEVGSVVGSVTDIGVRSSTIRTSEGIEILVPNSTFIENNVTNWTYSNAAVRRSVKVGVDYAASAEHVRDLLLGVCARHEQVLADPQARVLLEEFGADAMVFNLQYWIDYNRGADASLIASELRFMINGAFAEAGIVIPHPQRVLHLASEQAATTMQRFKADRAKATEESCG